MSTDFREHRLLGRTGLKVSRLGIASGYGVPAAAVEKAYHVGGINYFYWGSRRTDAMRDVLRRLAKSDRDRIVIALQSYDHHGAFLAHFFEKGLRELGTEYADVLILGYHNRLPRRRVIDRAMRLKSEGKLRFLALSGHNRPFFRKLAGQADSPVDVFMIRYNAAHRGAEEEIFPFLPAENRPGITTYTATRWGRLLKVRRMPPGEEPLSGSDCYRFALSNPNVDLCMAGPSSLQQMDEALRTLDLGPLSPEDMARARRIGDFVHG
ncbi:MAG: aldo/keto reductase [Acidobacteriota bacterium]